MPPPIVSCGPVPDPMLSGWDWSDASPCELPKVLRLIPHLRAKYCREGRNVGRQAEMMPADISMAVQPTVGAKVRDGVGDPGGDLVDAVTGDLWVPQLLDGDTDEDEDEHDCEAPTDDQDSDADGDAPDDVGLKNTNISATTSHFAIMTMLSIGTLSAWSPMPLLYMAKAKLTTIRFQIRLKMMV
ncbi:hypothetical protein PgNI_11037 [Pyricularia grisea]|uniref:Uncharacterized protein n=1 Tax=Pyricularia grisea TaxID=148305 RepID=A0A6P8AY28_PYRGI|nr:hypothetical protein PgNI_11037 [Pyricularia grisea]TLD07194.1 hypothetical protein PgNI_11037 [Pyricularia grisea]